MWRAGFDGVLGWVWSLLVWVGSSDEVRMRGCRGNIDKRFCSTVNVACTVSGEERK